MEEVKARLKALADIPFHPTHMHHTPMEVDPVHFGIDVPQVDHHESTELFQSQEHIEAPDLPTPFEVCLLS